jgi:hypothetical protein
VNDDMNHARRYSNDDGHDPGNDVHPPVHRLSEYLDAPADFSSAEREAIEGHLAGCQECQNVLTDLRLMVSTLRSLPEREAPRSFALTPAVLEPVKTPEVARPIVMQESAQWHARHAPKIRWATSIAAILFVFVISADLITNGIRGGVLGTDDSAGEVSVMSQDDAAADDTMPASAESADAIEESAPPADDMDVAGARESDDAQAEDEGEDAFRVTGDDEDAEEEEASALRMESEQISDEPESEMTASGDSTDMRWRVAEVSLALVLALLLAVLIGLPKEHGTRR